MTPRLLRSALLATAIALLAVPSSAVAANSMEIGIADENVLVGKTPGGTDATVAKWKASGVQDVRIFAQWDKFAPAPTATKAPADFKGADPASYDLAVLDQKIDAVVKHGLNVTLVVTGPGPVWGSTEPARRNGVWRPDPAKFGEFASAIAAHVGPRVDRYIVWNEPNISTWLQPQYVCTGKRSGRPSCESTAPHLYRELARSGYNAIHAADQNARVAIGGTSSFGQQFALRTNSATQPLNFLRTMSCVSKTYRTIKTGACRGYAPLNAEALAYHPHSTTYSPGKADPSTGNARMADLPRLIKVIDKIAAKKRLKSVAKAKMPLWLDEYGYQTNPPDTRDGHQTPAVAASYLQWGWSLAARNPRVETLTQYEWFDEPIGTGDDRNDRWQSGLFTVDGKAKPLAAVFANPIFGWRTNKTAAVWGQVRPGDAATTVRLQRGSGSTFRDYKTVTTDQYGVFQVTVPRSTSAKYRYIYVDPTTQAEVTSAVTTLRKTSK
jgi:hypothetical protein